MIVKQWYYRLEGHRKPPKFDHYQHLLFALCWVNDSLFYRSREANTGYAKSYVYEDLVHVLQAIIDEFYEHLTWPDDNCMHELATVYSGILRGCVGVGGVKEYETEKPKDSVKEKKSWSGKKKIDCYKMLSVMGHTGRFIFLSICLGKK